MRSCVGEAQVTERIPLLCDEKGGNKSFHQFMRIDIFCHVQYANTFAGTSEGQQNTQGRVMLCRVFVSFLHFCISAGVQMAK